MIPRRVASSFVAPDRERPMLGQADGKLTINVGVNLAIDLAEHLKAAPVGVLYKMRDVVEAEIGRRPEAKR